MTIRAIIHIVGEDAILGDLDGLPDPTHSYILVRNLRKKDGKPLTYVSEEATAFLYAWSRITFIELMTEVDGHTQMAVAAAPQGTTVLGFFRDDER
jgi:hypothetical protein